MTSMTRILAGSAAIGSLAAPATAQYYQQPQTYPYPQQQQQQTYPYPQQQPAYPYPQQQTYPGYGYNQGYPGNPATDIIDQLLGNRYSVTDRQAVRQCARAAQVQAQSQYGYGQQGYGQQGYGGYPYGQPGYRQNIAAPSLHVTAITEVQRRSNGLRVRGVMSSGYAGQYNQYGGQYGNAYGYPNQAYAGGDVTFRCDVDYRGAVTGIRIGHDNYRRY